MYTCLLPEFKSRIDIKEWKEGKTKRVYRSSFLSEAVGRDEKVAHLFLAARRVKRLGEDQYLMRY